MTHRIEYAEPWITDDKVTVTEYWITDDKVCSIAWPHEYTYDRHCGECGGLLILDHSQGGEPDACPVCDEDWITPEYLVRAAA